MNQSIQNNHTVSIFLTEHLYRIKDFHAHKLLAHNFYNVRMNQSVRKNFSFILELYSSNDLINSKSGKEKTILTDSSLSRNISREGDTI